MDSAESSDVDRTGSASKQVSVGSLIIGTVVLAALIRGLSSVMTSFLVWPLLGTVVTALFGTPVFTFGAALELLLTSVAVFAGLLVGVKARRDPEGWHRGIRRLGWLLTVDVVVYLVSVLVGVAVFARPASQPQFWAILLYIVLGNAVLGWLGVRVIRVGRALTPPPPEED